MDTGLEIFTLGGVRILRGGAPVRGLSKRKAEALLIYLASTRRPQPREVLADLLWDERTQSQALGNLRVLLTILHQALGESIIIRRDAVAINPATRVWLDSVEMEDGLQELHRQGRLTTRTADPAAEVLSLYKGEFLEGFSVSDCRQFEEWQVRERERLHHLAVDGYSELVAYDIEWREYQQGMVHAARLLELDPLMESAHRQMMLLLAKCGQLAAALSQYETCQKLLQAELGVQPSEETHNLYEQIRTGKLGLVEETEQLPSGTVTFLFMDIEGSTGLLERLRERYADVLAEHRQLMRSAIQKWHGQEVDTQGDSFFVAFRRANEAIGCAVEAQQRLSEHSWPQRVNVRVRMGLHTGEPIIGHTGYVGMDVHRAARIAGVGYGGQVLLSQTTHDLVSLTLPAGCRLRDLGAYMLKDIRFPLEIYQLEIPGLPNDFPPLQSLDKLEKEEEPPAPGTSPYMGLQYFNEEDAEWFFGRQEVTERLVQSVRSLHFLAVIGASGSGKSSIVRAGLVPAIKTRYPSQWHVKVITPSSHPLDALAICLTQGSESVAATATLIDDMQSNPRSLHLYIQKNIISGRNLRLLLVIDQFEELFTLCRSETERLAFVKNFLYAVGIPDSSMTGVITLRADFYAHLAQYVGLRELVSAHQVYIGAMKASELREAIEGPARRGGWEFSPGLVDLILSDLGAGENRQPEPGALPLLSHALLETWKRRKARLLNLKAYWEAGGVGGAIAKTAESVFYRDLTPDQQVIAKGIFLRLTELGEGTQDTRRRISIRELIPPGPAIEAEQIRTVLVKLADARLIITGEETVEVAHEALIREWPTLREWLTTDREGLHLHRHLTEAAQEWEMLEQDPGALYRGTRLNQAVEWAMANPRALSAQEQAYLEASRQAAEREQADSEAARRRELEAARKLAETEKGRAEAERQRAEEQGHSAKRLRWRAWLLGGVLVVALILAATAIILGRQANTNFILASQNLATAQSAKQHALSQQSTAESERLRAEGEAQQRSTAEAVAEQERGNAEIQARLATSRYLTTAALNNLKLNPQLSAHLALQALQIYPEDTFEAENTLHMVLPEMRLLSTTPITITRPIFINKEVTVFIARQGELFIHTIPQGIEVVDLAVGTRSMVTPDGSCVAVVPSSDGRWLAALCAKAGQQIDAENTIYETQVWDVEAKQLLFTLPDVPDLFPGLSFDYPAMGIIPPSTGHPLEVWATTWDVTIHVWDVSSGQELLVDRQHSAEAENSQVDGVVSADSRYLATFGSDGLVVFWNLETNEELLQFNGRSAGLWANFSPDGTHLAIAGNDEAIRIWDLTSLPSEPKLENRIDIAGVVLDGMFYSPDGVRLAAGGQDGYVRVWEARSGELQLILAGQAGSSWPLAFSRDQKRLYTSSGLSIMEWDISPGRELLTLPGRIGSMPFSPDGKRLALIGADHTISIVDSQTGAVIVPPWQAHTDWIEEVVWSPNGLRLATCSGYFNYIKNDNSARIWEAATGGLVKDLSVDWGFTTLAWSPDSSRLAASNFYSSTAFIWDAYSWDLLNTWQSAEGMFTLAYDPDGRKIATSSVYGFTVWDAISSSEVFTDTTGRTPLSLAFSPDSEHLAAGLTSGSILLYKMTETGMEKEQLGFAGGDSIVWALAFSPDGSLLAAGDGAGKIRVWEVESRKLRLELSTFSDQVSRLAFSPDGRRLVVSSQSGTTYFYVLPLDELVEQARSRIILPMTAEECWEYLHLETCPAWP